MWGYGKCGGAGKEELPSGNHLKYRQWKALNKLRSRTAGTLKNPTDGVC